VELATAAGIWFTAAISVAAGVGYEITALLVLFALNIVPMLLDKKKSPSLQQAALALCNLLSQCNDIKL
jgi:uncharacterized membrane protein YhiD involved in acid resistance